MKFLVASDLHGSLYWTEKLLNVFENGDYDMLILLGDLYYHGPRNPLTDGYNPKAVSEALNKIKNKLLVLKGNCDAEVDEMISEFSFEQSLSMKVGDKTILFSHGHKINKDAFPEGDFDVMFYGHFHTCFIENKDNKIFVNPGSISLPKDGTVNSFAVLGEKGIDLYDFDGNVIDSINF